MAASRYSIRKRTSIMGVALALIACQGYGNEPEDGPVPGPELTPPQAQKGEMRKLRKQEQIEIATQDLAKRLSIDPESVSLSGATAVQWRSSALGCPEPGMNYTQALVPGDWIMLRAGEKVYRYHARRAGQPFYCPDDRAEPPATAPGAD